MEYNIKNGKMIFRYCKLPWVYLELLIELYSCLLKQGTFSAADKVFMCQLFLNNSKSLWKIELNNKFMLL